MYLYIQKENEKIAQKCLNFEHWLCIKCYKESILYVIDYILASVNSKTDLNNICCFLMIGLCS